MKFFMDKKKKKKKKKKIFFFFFVRNMEPLRIDLLKTYYSIPCLLFTQIKEIRYNW